MTTVDLFVRHFLAIYFTLIGLHYSSRSYALSERMGFSYINYGKRGSKTWWYRYIFNLFRAAILIVCVARLFLPVDLYLGVIGALNVAGVQIAGVILMLTSFCVIDYVHAYMHMDWRSGIDPAGDQELICTGPFSRTRNPMFLGILLGQLGFFLALPSWFSLVCLVVGGWVIYHQALEEERSLKQRFGKSYERYSERVPRWF